MSNSSTDYTYQYAFETSVDSSEKQPLIRLSTSLQGTSEDVFFEGRIRNPRTFGLVCRVLGTTINTRFYHKLDKKVLDPVLTSGGGMLRMEGFSSCCGVYSRIDLNPEAFDIELRGKGTTNVDFNPRSMEAFTRLHQQEWAQLQVGGMGLRLNTQDGQIIERKVSLPTRWIKGFCEVHAYLPRLRPIIWLTRHDLKDLFSKLPRGAMNIPYYLHKSGSSIRVSSYGDKNSVRLHGSSRLKVLEPLIVCCTSCLVWYDKESHTSALEVRFDGGAFFHLISPELNRGFSGKDNS